MAHITINYYPNGHVIRTTSVTINGVEYDIYNVPKNSVINEDIFLGAYYASEYMQLYQLPDLSTCTLNGNYYCYGQKFLKSLHGVPHTINGSFHCYWGHFDTLIGGPKYVGGNYDCEGVGLTSLEGAPTHVGGNFNCSCNRLTSLEHCPSEIGKDLDCSGNKLTSLHGAPEIINGDFLCNFNKCEMTLDGAPSIVFGDFSCKKSKLTSLKGGPTDVGGKFDVGHNLLETLHGAPKNVEGHFYCDHNQLKNLEGCPETIGGGFGCCNNQLTSLVGGPRKIGTKYLFNLSQLHKKDPKNPYGKLIHKPNTWIESYGCWNNPLTSLMGAPQPHEVRCDLTCGNDNLDENSTAPEYLAAPQIRVWNVKPELLAKMIENGKLH